MTEKITVYQKPTCSKCRETLRLLKEKGVPLEAINYYEKPVTANLLRELLKKLGMAPAELLRKDEPIARSLGISKRPFTDEELIQLMVENPDLMQRPIVVRGNKAVLGRPPANVELLF
jgi:arsenate reductase